MQDKLLSDKIRSLPQSPGVYQFYDKEEKIIYVGKAKSLNKRVGQYFQKNLKDGKTKQLVENITDVSYIEVFSELEALLLEANLIKKYRPRYNINLKDDKSYLYIVVRRQDGVRKIITSRASDLLAKDIYFGPFPDATTTKQLVRALRRVFPFRDCTHGKYVKYKNLGSVCLYGHLNLCPGPCTDRVTLKEYEKGISSALVFLRGGYKKIILSLTKKMQDRARQQEYEEADAIKKLKNKMEYVQQQFRSPTEFIENPYLAEDIYTQSLEELVVNIPILRKAPNRIECYDVANISGKDAAVSMVVALNGRIDKSLYRKFRIKLKSDPDDPLMLKEALFRRLGHEVDGYNKKSWGMPDLIVVDGGKGQLGAALDILKQLNLDIPVIGIAKRYDNIIYFSNGFSEYAFERRSEGLKLLQRLRDESHRFARVYHHQLRSKGLKK